MRHQEIKEGQKIKNLIDPKVPLKFTGKRKEITQYGTTTILLFFEPVKTPANKNWFNSLINPVSISFDLEAGNQYIKTI